MRKTFLRQTMAAVLFTATFGSGLWAQSPATRILSDDFDYDVGNLYVLKSPWQPGDWMCYGSNTGDPVQVVEGNLTYPGYSTGVGNSIQLAKTTSSAQDPMVKFENPVGNGSLFVSFLVKPENIDRYCGAYFLSLFSETKAGIGNKGSGTETGRLFAVGTDGGLQLGIHRVGSNTTCVKSPTLLTEGNTYLVVMEYQIVDGTTNDVMNLWVNPTTNGTQPDADASYSGTSGSDINLSYGGIAGLELRQGGSTYTGDTPLQIDALRCATSWIGLFDEASTPEGNGIINASPSTYGFDPIVAGQALQAQALITASGLTDDIAITCSPGVTASRTVISKDNQALQGGVLLSITAIPAPAASGSWTGTVTLSSPGAQDAVITLTCDVVVPTTFAQAARVQQLYDADGAWMEIYKYTGKAVVTHIEEKDGAYLVYAQDMTGAFCLNTIMGAVADGAVTVGDEITNLTVMISDDDAVGLQLIMYPLDMETGELTFEKTATGKIKTPTDITLSDFTAADNQYKLVRLQGVSFADNGQFAARSYTVTDGDGHTASVRPFADTDLIGTDIPATANVTGISKSKNSVVIWPRTAADIEAAAAAVSITPQKLFNFDNDAAPINTDTPIMKFTVTAANVAADAPISMTGANREMFSVTPAVIPAGTGEYEVTVNYHPTTIGMHKGGIYFDFDGTSAEFNYSATFATCKAYDPQNLPTLTLSPQTVTLSAAQGESSTASVTMNVANACDYINVTRGSQANLGITLSSSMFIPSVATNNITVTFRPVTDNNVEETFTFTTLKGESVVLNVHGNVTGNLPEEEREGDEFVLDASAPLSICFEDFETAQHNQALSIAGWTNVANTGTRAWWGYVCDDFTAAKVTAYDSRVPSGQGSDCEMLLVSPALSYSGADSKTLKFDLMGRGLYEGMTDVLDICLIELVDGQPAVYPMSGFGIPVTDDYNDVWINYDNIDMSVVPDMPDPFFIGFRLQSNRGTDSAAQYFIDNFKWGEAPTAIGCIPTNPADGLYTVYNLQGARVMFTYDKNDLKCLTPGIYIINGRKTAVK